MKMLSIVIIAAAAFAALGAAAGFYFYVRPAPAPPAPAGLGDGVPLHHAIVRVGAAQFAVEVADTTSSRAQGLSGRPSLPKDGGMLFVFGVPAPYGFWMKGMNFPLDFVWVKGNMVVGVTQNAPAPSPGAFLSGLKVYFPPANVDKVLEVNAGTVQKYAVKARDAVEVVRE